MSDLVLSLHPPKPFADRLPFHFGTAARRVDDLWTADGVGLRSRGRYVVPVMGEIHYTRLRHATWRDALLKMKAGGITVIASYVFWIHHEERAGRLDFSGDRDLRAFVALCGDLGLPCVIRCGPWCHGEVRNGGLPEWVLDRHPKTLRTDDPAYLADVAAWYAAIAGQLRGLLWKDGGPVIGIQIENEYGGRPQHLLTLKKLAIDAGLDVPFYTRTGWPELDGPMPFGELLPLFGGYAEGFWDRELETMPWRYRSEFVFKTVRTDAAIANEHFGDKAAKDDPDAERYPYLTCEIGAGMMPSYHRRITAFAQDALALGVVKLGSGSNGLGWYMYHGGTNPEGIEPNLNEHQATRYTNYNDLPVKNYDFQTALGQYGQVREQYHLLRPLHLFLADFGQRLAPLATKLPPASDDPSALRYGVRSDGERGFVFVNNYQRLRPMPAVPNVRFEFGLRSGRLRFPETPVTVAADCSFVWPFNLDLGGGATLVYATAHLICQIDDNDERYVVFARTGNPAEFAFAGDGVTIEAAAKRETPDGRTVLADVQPGRSPVATVTAPDGRQVRVLLLDEADARRLWKGDALGRTRLVLTDANVIFDEGDLRLTPPTDVPVTTVLMLPAPAELRAGDDVVAAKAEGVFGRFDVATPLLPPVPMTVRQTRQAGPLRPIPIGVAGVAVAPTDADFDDAAAWQITLPPEFRPEQALLRVHYAGDVARASCGGRLITDHFYNGTPFDVGLAGLGEGLRRHGVTLEVLPLPDGAPIYMLDSVRPQLEGGRALGILGVEIVRAREVRLGIGPAEERGWITEKS